MSNLIGASEEAHIFVDARLAGANAYSAIGGRSLLKLYYGTSASESSYSIAGDSVVLENQIDTNVATYMHARGGQPSSHSEAATEPGTWSLADIRALWLQDLFDQ